jgi:hypothetical protein
VVFNSREMVVAAAAAGDSFRVCQLDDGIFGPRIGTGSDLYAKASTKAFCSSVSTASGQ